ncbi:MAG: UDP-N-acetylmuramoyl-tripeptide--D-alanyl-D-alanine ligase [Clostridiales bacterium]|nr:UDP-N-acetylmuramoyl-tripeptide--D-alanyl-D-alanine ligase [Clostridiales bacterium]
MAKFTLQEILDVTKGELHQLPEGVSPETYVIDGVSTDTREISEGNLFLALCGENFDGNKFAVAAKQDGACALVLSTMEYCPEEIPVVLVPDTKLAYEKIAEAYRLKLGCRVVAVTGSVGKTSTREMIAGSLAQGCKVYVTQNNNNNEIGLSKTILNTPEDTDVLVLEMGMRARGEISELTHIAHPDVAVITNIGVAHMEILGSRDEILLAKLEILECLTEGGLLIIPYADEYLQKAVSRGLIRQDVRIAYTSKEPVLPEPMPFGLAYASSTFIGDDHISATVEAGFGILQEYNLTIPVLGEHHVGNALAGLLCGLYFGLDPESVIAGIASFTQIGHRERQVACEGINFYDDAYNAGPESMMSAFETVRRLAKGKRAYACIGDMLELGDVASKKHFEIGAKAASVGLDGLLVIGDFQKNVVDGAYSVNQNMPVFIFSDKEKMALKLTELVTEGDWVLLKASHAFEMYTILDSYGSIVRKGNEP